MIINIFIEGVILLHLSLTFNIPKDSKATLSQHKKFEIPKCLSFEHLKGRHHVQCMELRQNLSLFLF